MICDWHMASSKESVPAGWVLVLGNLQGEVITAFACDTCERNIIARYHEDGHRVIMRDPRSSADNEKKLTVDDIIWFPARRISPKWHRDWGWMRTGESYQVARV